MVEDAVFSDLPVNWHFEGGVILCSVNLHGFEAFDFAAYIFSLDVFVWGYGEGAFQVVA